MNRPTRNTLFGAMLCLAIAGFYGCQAHAEPDYSSGNFMLSHCEHYITENYSYEVWDGQCGGVVGALMYFGTSLNEKARFCPPKDATNSQAGHVVVNYMHSHPEFLHLNFQGLAAIALQAAWPCK